MCPFILILTSLQLIVRSQAISVYMQDANMMTFHCNFEIANIETDKTHGIVT